ncbi:hypothetical protein Sphch_2730 [Sphingobium chlorophenolicum L-1]|uniref:Uncharacterized protein n=2 Tax=Sphingobium chlorophenolicum TaxID=46429 RepID=F6F0Q0_SPHCR|nr:hypothetical protein Sphch_2730 [Sphingobium chlorophenolicum L-1]
MVCPTGKNRARHRRSRGRFAVLDPVRSMPGARLSFEDQEAMMTVQQHIDELRAELSWNDDVDEIRQIETELQAALEELERQRREV